jgi:hypothetical protein
MMLLLLGEDIVDSRHNDRNAQAKEGMDMRASKEREVGLSDNFRVFFLFLSTNLA